MLIKKIKIFSESTEVAVEFWAYELLAPLVRYNLCSHTYQMLNKGIYLTEQDEIDDKLTHIYQLVDYATDDFTKQPTNNNYDVVGIDQDGSTFYRNNLGNRIMHFAFWDSQMYNDIINSAFVQDDNTLLMTIETDVAVYSIDVGLEGMIVNGNVELKAYDNTFRVEATGDTFHTIPIPLLEENGFFNFDVATSYFGKIDEITVDNVRELTDIFSKTDFTMTLTGSFEGFKLTLNDVEYMFDFVVNETLFIDGVNGIVKVDGVAVDYTTVFPVLRQGINVFVYDFIIQQTVVTSEIQYDIRTMVVI